MLLRPHPFLQPLHRLNVVCKHVQATAGQQLDVIQVALEVRGEALHQQAGLAALELLDSGRKVAGTTIWQVVTVHTGQDNVPGVRAMRGEGGYMWARGGGGGWGGVLCSRQGQCSDGAAAHAALS